MHSCFASSLSYNTFIQDVFCWVKSIISVKLPLIKSEVKFPPLLELLHLFHNIAYVFVSVPVFSILEVLVSYPFRLIPNHSLNNHKLHTVAARVTIPGSVAFLSWYLSIYFPNLLPFRGSSASVYNLSPGVGDFF